MSLIEKLLLSFIVSNFVQCQTCQHLSSYEKLCSDNSTHCSVFLELDTTPSRWNNCHEYCFSHGLKCKAAFDEMEDNCIGKSDIGCFSSKEDQICVCEQNRCPTYKEHKRITKCRGCDGYVKNLVLKYTGKEANVQIRQFINRERVTIFSGKVQTNQEIKLYGKDHDGSLGHKLFVKVGHCETAQIMTDCRHEISPGTKIGDWEVVRGESQFGGVDHPDCNSGRKGDPGVGSKVYNFFVRRD
ncbi:hypothetical protein MHBO_002707 [Bonamia ostreae]|uniref:Uncharacterized protein n=1 Tax=Bonamia ostreae TaxID=126728 RepID=A0ABV2AN84_9EUKA